ncbi:MAG: Fis family transcriptional regulator [Alkalinema sp. RL_2_19]|nr:Fis family transcriptional regulator [Alkalinema sp. RL_2_19]
MNAPFDASDSTMNPTNPSNPHQAPDNQRSSNERFELLSAYMDGEVTAEERRLVESWLANEPKVQQMHQRLLMLKHGFSAMSAPEPTQSVNVTIDKVFEQVERRSRFRVIIGGVAAAAAAGVALVVGIIPLPMAQHSSPKVHRIAA